MMCKHLSYFGQAVTAATLNLLSNLSMQCSPRFGQQALIERVPYKRVFEDVIARLVLKVDQIKRLHYCEPFMDARIANSAG